MSYPLLVALIPLLYSGINSLELSAVLARLSGIACKRPMLGISIQQSVYMGTRLLIVMMLPFLALLVDNQISLRHFSIMSHLSLFLAGLFGIIVLLLRNKLITYYIYVIHSYEKGNSLWTAFIIPDFGKQIVQLPPLEVMDILRDVAARKVFLQSIIVFTIYSSGIFIAFYFSAAIPEYSTTLSHTSGVVNALGAFLLTFVIEPKLGISVDTKSENASKLVFSLFLGRLFSLLIVAQILLFLTFNLIDV